jgi:uncharacterized protein YdbL (DUF1318 family)
MHNRSLNLKTAVETQSNGATEKSKPYMKNMNHQCGESQKWFFQRVIPGFYSVAQLLSVSNVFFRLKISLALGLALFFSGCTLAKLDVNVVSGRTSLENQVLGTYNNLSEDMLLVASVRGVSPTGTIEAPPRHTPEQIDATRAMETIAFHADDIETFKRFGWVGENQEGLLTPFTRETPKVTSAELKSFAANYSEAEFQQVLKEVNQAREVLMMRVVQTNENFTIKDLPAIRKVFAKINRQNSAIGSKVQDADGRWQTL